MIAPLEFPGALQRQQIPRIGHHTNQAVTAFKVAADLAFRFSGKVKTGLALAHLSAGGQQRIRKLMDLLLRLIEQMEGQSLGGSRPDAGQAFKLIDQPGQRSSEAAQ